MSLLIPSSVQTMTSREVVAVINSQRPEGKAELRHDTFVAKLLKLEEELDLPKILEVEYVAPNNAKYTQYLLDKETCLLMVASETPKVLHAIIKRWQELEAKQALPQSNDVQFDRAMKFVTLITTELNLPESGKLSIMGKLADTYGLPKQLLPSYGIDAPPESIVTTGSSAPTFSLTTGLKGYSMSARTANQILISIGILEERTRPSTKTGEKTFKAFTDKGLRYGKNVTSPNNPREVQPHFYVDTFPVILALLGL